MTIIIIIVEMSNRTVSLFLEGPSLEVLLLAITWQHNEVC